MPVRTELHLAVISHLFSYSVSVALKSHSVFQQEECGDKRSESFPSVVKLRPVKINTIIAIKIFYMLKQLTQLNFVYFLCGG